MNRVEKVLALRAQGYNCAQAVAAAFEDIVEYDAGALLDISTGFGAGGGDMQGTCGAVSAMYLIIGIVLSKKCGGGPAAKGKTMAACKELAKAFREKNKSTICKELKGVETGTVLRSCNGCVEDAALILERYLNENELG